MEILYKPFSNPNKVSPNAPWWSKTKKRLIVNQTPQERLFFQKIKERWPKLRIIPQKTFHIKGKRFFLDFYIPRIKLAIEIDGGYHLHQKKEDMERDHLVFVTTGRWTVRYTNEEIDSDCDKVVDDIISAIKYLENDAG